MECGFGMLVKKFRIFHIEILLSSDKVETIILTVCALNNMIREPEHLLHEIILNGMLGKYVHMFIKCFLLYANVHKYQRT